VIDPSLLLGDVSILQQPLSDSIAVANISKYQLTCDASNYHPDLPVIWVKDGIYINITRLPPQGFTLNLSQAYAGLSLSTPGELQGYYHCEVWSLSSTPQRYRVKSDEALLTFVGKSAPDNFSCQMFLTNLRYH
jgi:hypothetical protein